ncbi:trypsin-like peptidase domain-containing protein [Nonomuraea sp. NPDC050227]|uniref:VMAP-C domain-containing protein n=1 Tax=Nonomuraea sp. NPDC050227 TaxID=3364360 RepID=UPI0037A10480
MVSRLRSGGVSAPVVSVLRHGEARAAGAAALISRHRILTCAHVINDALGRDDPHCSEPPPVKDFTLEFHSGDVAPHRGTARVSVWIAPSSRGAPSPAGDLAVLDLCEPAPEWLTPISWGDMVQGQLLRAWHGSGQQVTFADTEVKLCDGRVGYLDAPLVGAAIGPGYSGGPLWSLKQPVAVGLVVAHIMPNGTSFDGQRPVRRSRALPWQAVRAELLRAGALDVVEDCSVLSAVTQAQEDLLPSLWALLGDPATRALHAQELAEKLGYPVPGACTPSVSELAAQLATHSRALATLSESLALAALDEAARTALTTLLLRGRVAGMASLLSVSEYTRLVTELQGLVETSPTLIPRTAREALRFTPLPEVLHPSRLSPDDIPLAVAEMEALSDSSPVPDGSPQVPVLLYLVECVAAVVGGRERTVLQEWSERVAKRLGVHPSALAQRRADAESWATHRSASVADIRVELQRAAGDPENRYTCNIRLLSETGPGVCLLSKDSPLTPQEVARLIRDAVDGIQSDPGQGNRIPRLNVVVDRAGLHVPVDEWHPGQRNVFVPGLPLGVEFQLTLSCPEMSDLVPTRDGEQRRRWASGCETRLVIDPDCSAEQVTLQLLQHSHRDTTHVMLRGPHLRRTGLLDLCLALGVPVVLWDRTAETCGQTSRLAPSRLSGPLRDLPEQVRSLRAETFGDPDRHAARPSLVWEAMDPSPAHSLQLLDPMEGTVPS